MMPPCTTLADKNGRSSASLNKVDVGMNHARPCFLSAFKYSPVRTSSAKRRALATHSGAAVCNRANPHPLPEGIECIGIFSRMKHTNHMAMHSVREPLHGRFISSLLPCQTNKQYIVMGWKRGYGDRRKRGDTKLCLAGCPDLAMEAGVQSDPAMLV